MDLSLRKLRYFIAVADELHFGRAAGHLYIAQQSLSTQIRELEDEVGARLLHRTTRKVELTPAGEIFLAAARQTLAILDTAVDEARSAARGDIGTLKVGFVIAAALELTQPILTEFRARYPDVQLELREFTFADTSAGLADGQTDVAFLRLPTSAAGIQAETLFVEPRVVALAKDHPLACRDSVDLDDVLTLPIAVGTTSDTAWQEFWTLADYRDGGKPLRVVNTHSQTEENEIVASGEACAITAACTARYTPHAGIRLIPVSGISGSPAVIAWHADRRTVLVDRLVEVAREVRDREGALIAGIEHPFGQSRQD